MTRLMEFLESKLPEKKQRNRKVEITRFEDDRRMGFSVTRKFSVKNSFKEPFNYHWKYFSKLRGRRYLLYEETDESLTGILRNMGVAKNLNEANQRLYNAALEGADLIAWNYGGIIVDYTNFEHDAMKQPSRRDTIGGRK